MKKILSLSQHIQTKVEPDESLVEKYNLLTEERKALMACELQQIPLATKVEPDENLDEKFTLLTEEHKAQLVCESRPNTSPIIQSGNPTDIYFSSFDDQEKTDNIEKSKQSIGICESNNSRCFLVSSTYAINPSHCFEADTTYKILFPSTGESRDARLVYVGELGFSILKLNEEVNCSTAPLQTESPVSQGCQIRGKDDDIIHYSEMTSTTMQTASFMMGEGSEKLTQKGDCGSIRVDKHTGCVYAFHIGKLNSPGLQTKYPTGIKVADIINELENKNPDLATILIDKLRSPKTFKMDTSTAPTMDNDVDLEGRELPKSFEELLNALNGGDTNKYVIAETPLILDGEISSDTYKEFINELREVTIQATKDGKLGVVFTINIYSKPIEFVIHINDSELWYIIGKKKSEKENPWRTFTETSYTKIINIDSFEFSFNNFLTAVKQVSQWPPMAKKRENCNLTKIPVEIKTDNIEYLSMIAFFICESLRFESVFKACQKAIENKNEKIQWGKKFKDILNDWMDILNARGNNRDAELNVKNLHRVTEVEQAAFKEQKDEINKKKGKQSKSKR